MTAHQETQFLYPGPLRYTEDGQPLQPYADISRLLADKTVVDRTIMPELAKNFSLMFTGRAGHSMLRPPKSNRRIDQKTMFSLGDSSRLTDLCGGRTLLRDIEQVKKAIDCFYARGLMILPNGQLVMVTDVENTFSTPSPRKPGMRSLDIKLAVPVGDETYHTIEWQFRAQAASTAHDKSHKAYEQERSCRAIAQRVAETMPKFTGQNAVLRGLERCYRRYVAEAEGQHSLRDKFNREAIAAAPWQNDLIGYQPMAQKKLDVSRGSIISLPVPAMVAA